MSYNLKILEEDDLELMVQTSVEIYAKAEPDKYPDFKITQDPEREDRFRKFYKLFVMPSRFNNHNVRRAFGLYKDDECVALVGVRRWGHIPSWSVSWLLSANKGIKFIPLFRIIMTELCKFHEEANMNEFFVTYPSDREAAYSRIMLPFREKYFTFVECTVPKGERHAYGFIHELMGGVLHPHDMSLRRYILRRDNTEPESVGGKAIRKNNAKN